MVRVAGAPEGGPRPVLLAPNAPRLARWGKFICEPPGGLSCCAADDPAFPVQNDDKREGASEHFADYSSCSIERSQQGAEAARPRFQQTIFSAEKRTALRGSSRVKEGHGTRNFPMSEEVNPGGAALMEGGAPPPGPRQIMSAVAARSEPVDGPDNARLIGEGPEIPMRFRFDTLFGSARIFGRHSGAGPQTRGLSPR
jgi:hypothetical protein